MFYAVLLVLAAILVLTLILRDDLARAQQRQREESRGLREEVSANIQRFAGQTEQRNDSLRAAVAEMQRDQQRQLEAIRGVVDQRLHALQTDNAAKLEQMRQTVDEKLQTTLEARLGESFRLVSERLEQVHKGLGEMQNSCVRRGRSQARAQQRDDARGMGRSTA